MRDSPPRPRGNPYVANSYDVMSQEDMDAWADGILSKVQTILKGHDPWAAPPRPPSPLRAETPPPAEPWTGQYEYTRDEEEDLFGERSGKFSAAE